MTKAAFTRNNKILLSQLHYCRFLYYFIKNSRTLLVKERTVEKLKIVVYKHIVKLTKQLADEKENWLQLKEWESFTQSRLYKSTQTTMQEYADRYEREYLNCIKHTSSEIIREVNK